MSTTKKRYQEQPNPELFFTPEAWHKLIAMRDYGDTEIGGFGIAMDPTRPLLIHDFVLPKQKCTSVTVEFDDDSVADFYEDQVAAGRQPFQFGRVWIHTHPGECPEPSQTDEATFHRVFGRCDWAVMFIIAKGGDTYCRIRFNTGVGGHMEIPVYVAYGETSPPEWKAEYEKAVQTFKWISTPKETNSHVTPIKITDRRASWVQEELDDKQSGWTSKGWSLNDEVDLDEMFPQTYSDGEDDDDEELDEDEVEEAQLEAMADDWMRSNGIIDDDDAGAWARP